MNVRVLIADDELVARQRLARLLANAGGNDLVAECVGGEAAVEQIVALAPDIVILDVQMPDLDGFGVLRALEGRVAPVVVFVTAFDRYAVRAFEVHAVDYLLKPYDTDRFEQAFGRAREHAAMRDAAADDRRMRAMLAEMIPRRQPRLDRIAVKTNGTVRLVRTADVDWIETDGNYLRLHVGATSHLVRMTAITAGTELDPAQFVRIHRKYIVNIDRIAEIQPWFAGDAVVVLRTGVKLRMSRTHRENLDSRLLGGARDQVR